jgi:hypothetical protein
MVINIENARKIVYTKSRIFGFYECNTKGRVPIKRLVICKYDEAEQEYYLFACDQDLNVLESTLHVSMRDAKLFAESHYQQKDIVWLTA